MTTVNINNLSQPSISIDGINSVSFYHVGNKVFSATMADEIYGVFLSQVIVAPSNFIKWSDFSIDTLAMDNVWVYVRTADSNIGEAQWIGPFKNKENEFDNVDKQLMQFMVVLRDDGTMNTAISKIKMNFVSSQDSKLFFSKAFNIGFRAEHIILTYNADKSQDSVLRFAIAGEETADISKYQYIEANKIQELYNLPLYADKIKVMMELAGDSGIPISVHEIAIMFSGKDYTKPSLDSIPPEESGTYLIDENGAVLVSEDDEIIVF